jgi:hypothetical protein
MRPTRERLREIEWHALWDGRAEGLKSQAKLGAILEEINKAFGPRPGLLTWETGLAFREDTGKIIDNPTSWKAWLDGLSNLSARAASRLIYRRPVAEIHQLQKELPGPRALEKLLYELFGDLKN